MGVSPRPGALPGSASTAAAQRHGLHRVRRQRHAITTLAQLPATLADEALGSPSVLVIGDVVRGVAAWALPTDAMQTVALRSCGGC